MRLLIAALLLVGSVRAEAAASPVQLVFRDGMIWLVARDATLAQLFDEWTRVGQTTVVNADQLSGRVSIELSGMPEGQALDLLLRDVGGFLAVQRVAAVAGGNTASRFAQIVIMPGRKPASAAPVSASAAAVSQPPAPTAVPIAPGVQRLIGPDGQPVPDDQDGDVPAPTAPRSGFRPLPPGFSTPPQTPPVPAPPQSGPVGSPVPGMIVPAPGSTPAPQPPRRPSGLD